MIYQFTRKWVAFGQQFEAEQFGDFDTDRPAVRDWVERMVTRGVLRDVPDGTVIEVDLEDPATREWHDEKVATGEIEALDDFPDPFQSPEEELVEVKS